MSVITSALRADKALPVIPIDSGSASAVAEYSTPLPSMSPLHHPSWNANKVLPAISVESSLSGVEIDRLHDLWNGAALSARAHRKRGRGQGSSSIKIPDPISIPDPKNIPSALPSVSLSVKSATPSSTGTRKRWGFLSARPQIETPEVEKTIPHALEVLRAKAQERLKKKLKYTKSTPDLGRQAIPVVEMASAEPVEVESGAEAGGIANGLCSEVARKSLTLEELEEMDGDAIYFTLDPSWRDSRNSVQFRFITPVPDEHGPLGRPDSPLLHRHHSLDQLSSVAQEDPSPVNSMELTEGDSSNVSVHPIDELHSFLDF